MEEGWVIRCVMFKQCLLNSTPAVVGQYQLIAGSMTTTFLGGGTNIGYMEGSYGSINPTTFNGGSITALRTYIPKTTVTRTTTLTISPVPSTPVIVTRLDTNQSIRSSGNQIVYATLFTEEDIGKTIPLDIVSEE